MRTRAQIDEEYKTIAMLYGDRVFKGAMLQSEIKPLHDRLVQLTKEPASDGKEALELPVTDDLVESVENSNK
jgi:hypothetical protein